MASHSTVPELSENWATLYASRLTQMIRSDRSPLPEGGAKYRPSAGVPNRRDYPAEADYAAGCIAEEWRGAWPLRLSAARSWINATACHVSEDLSKNRSAPSRRLRFSYS